ncbi:DNA repair protein RecO [Algibacter amylolyticus]|uniref:DNA repair protein RecO n=1 Tax=Algibacter amylolyticus TaxID=1608400 RepID=A0A5M7BFJ0_9FLAO|nr:DNA repair protein RecO [Algibacter amylolyticus]KAA5827287.1 DNA repair protein RecO [Algibacter amylolyticus]MBB5266468.1 DNA repair protein RecO (recombination protein O) [Algibacter amylolyticus]TSJ81532.1 DNA repair protein RecO [Algibacter amylolyticus]
MLITTNAIVLSKLKFKDNDLIVKCYTQDIGVVSFLLRGVLKSKKGNSKVAYFQLLSQIEIVFTHKNTRSLQSIKETKLNHMYSSLHTHVLKSSIVMFLSEVLSNVLQEEEENEVLYSYLEYSLLWLDSQADYANFHLLFLLKLTKYLGFYPDTSNIDAHYFNLYEGKFELKPSNKYAISGENLVLLKQLLGIKFDALTSIKINAKQRQSFLSMILLYFELHLGTFKTPKSLAVFNQVFN